jgi:hypothetical protein
VSGGEVEAWPASQQRGVERGAAQHEIVQGDVEKPVVLLRELQRLLRPL